MLAELVALRRRAGDYLRADGAVAEDEYFFAEQNAIVVADAEEYYRTMFGDAAASWNLRDRHMADTLDHLVAHLDRRDGAGRVVVWEHNSHIGDARATEMARRGELNLGQLMRERHPGDVVLVGFTTHAGTVTAADGWGEPAQRMRVRPALEGSYEALFHETGVPAFLLCPPDGGAGAAVLREPRLERAIGVIYRPRDRAPEPLVRRRPRGPVRRGRPHRREPGRRAARAGAALGPARAPRDLPQRPVAMTGPTERGRR